MAATNRKKRPRTPTRPVVKRGGKVVQVPLLRGPVGPEQPALRAKYPSLNTPIDVETVQFYLTELIDIHYLTVQGSPGWTQGCIVNSRPGLDESGVAAVKQFQKKMNVTDPEETGLGLIKPDGPTLLALVDYADYAGKLDAAKRGLSAPAGDYIFYGSFDVEKFIRLYKDAFSRDPKYTAATEPNLRQLLSFMTADPAIIDLRWMAYILATTCWEASAPMTETAKNAQGKTITIHPWRMTWSPVEEADQGQGRQYARPVKVFQQADGTVRVTEWDGDQWTVKRDGTTVPLSKLPHRGVNTTLTAPVNTYGNDPGTEFTYYGRGYVQLTWWSNYATAGVHIGQGINLLLNPDLALDPAIAYRLMSYCLRTGYGFANNHKLGDFFYGGGANYTGARSMVNGTDHAHDIARIAKQFEVILKESRN